MITTAIIPVAGYGTRRLPITKTIEKCMLPICNRPIIDYIVSDCLLAGVTDIYFVISPGSHQLQDYYSHNRPLEQYLEAHNKSDQLPLITPPENINFHYIEQDPNDKYGTAVPVALALQEIGTQNPVAVLMGDDFIFRTDGGSTLADMISAYEKFTADKTAAAATSTSTTATTGATTTTEPNNTTASAQSAVMLAAKIPKDDPRKFGFIKLKNGDQLAGISEALTAAEAPTNLINVSRYIMPPALLEAVLDYVSHPTTDPEYYLTTVPFDNFLSASGTVHVLPATGEYLDGGSLSGWLHANQVVANSSLFTFS